MGFMATLTAALKAIPEITGLIKSLVSEFGKLRDSIDDRNFENYERELYRQARRLRDAKTEEEVRDIIRSLNPPK